MLPGVMGFIMYSLSNQEMDRRLYGGKAVISLVAKVALRYLEAVERAMIDANPPSGMLYGAVAVSADRGAGRACH